jgi:hypothetical protein
VSYVAGYSHSPNAQSIRLFRSENRHENAKVTPQTSSSA